MSSVHDMEKAGRTYGSFVGSLKWVVPLLAVIVLLVVMMIAG
ncbi:hypothetical protein [Qipengyuania spongiae]|nr:hypothetical protein [Qipengyuania spongiae]